MGRCVECENFSSHIKRDFKVKEMTVKEVREIEPKSVNRRRLNTFA